MYLNYVIDNSDTLLPDACRGIFLYFFLEPRIQPVLDLNTGMSIQYPSALSPEVMTYGFQIAGMQKWESGLQQNV